MSQTTKYNSFRSIPKPAPRALKDHRPVRWLVRQWFSEVDEQGEYRREVITGYSNKLDNSPTMAPSLAQALFNINHFGGELYADYSDGQPILVKQFN
jgi:hypothetical protein